MAVAHYSAERDYMDFLRHSYVGGQVYQNPPLSTLATARIYEMPVQTNNDNPYNVVERKINSYLVPYDQENKRKFERRANVASLINICKPAVDAYTQAVCSNVKRNFGQYQALIKNLDIHEQSYEKFIERFATDFAVHGFGFAIVDIHPTKGTPMAISIKPQQIAWILIDNWGLIQEFAYINQAEYASQVAPSNQHFNIRVWNKEGWSDRKGIVNIGVNSLADSMKDLVPYAWGPLPKQLKGELPVIVGYFEKNTDVIFPHGVPLISDLALTQKRIYNLMSSINEINTKSAFPLLTIPVERTMGNLQADAERVIGSENALPYNANSGQPQWIAPDPKTTSELRNEVLFEIQWGLKPLGLELATDTTSSPVSGINLRIKARDFESRCRSFANNMADFEAKLIRKALLLAGIDDVRQESEVSVTYPQRYTLPDSSEEIQNMMTLLTLQQRTGIDPGLETKIVAVKKLIEVGLPLDDEESQRLIEDMVDTMRKQVAEENDQSDVNRMGRMLARRKLLKASKDIAPDSDTPAMQTVSPVAAQNDTDTKAQNDEDGTAIGTAGLSWGT